MNEKRAILVRHIQQAMLAARDAGEPMTELLLEQALREAMGSDKAGLAEALARIPETDWPNNDN